MAWIQIGSLGTLLRLVGNGAAWLAATQTLCLALGWPGRRKPLCGPMRPALGFFSQTEPLLSSPHLTVQFSVPALFPHQASTWAPVLLTGGSTGCFSPPSSPIIQEMQALGHQPWRRRHRALLLAFCPSPVSYSTPEPDLALVHVTFTSTAARPGAPGLGNRGLCVYL